MLSWNSQIPSSGNQPLCLTSKLLSNTGLMPNSSLALQTQLHIIAAWNSSPFPRSDSVLFDLYQGLITHTWSPCSYPLSAYKAPCIMVTLGTYTEDTQASHALRPPNYAEHQGEAINRWAARLLCNRTVQNMRGPRGAEEKTRNQVFTF